MTVTETEEKPKSLPEIHQELMTVINDIDVKLDSLVDSDTAGKRKIGNDLVEATSGTFGAVVDQLVPQIREMDADTQAGVYLGLVRALRAAFDEEVSKLIEERAATLPKVAPLVTEDEAKELSKARSELYQKAKSVVDLAKQFGNQDLDMPKMRRGSRGKRGPRALSFYTWAINGVAVPEASDSVKGVSELLGFEKAADFTKALRDGRENEQDKVDTTNPPDEFTWTHPDGRIVTATRDEDDTEDSTEDDLTTPESAVETTETVE